MQSMHDIWSEAGKVCGAPDGEFSKPTSYLDYYEREFQALRERPLTIVEVGVFRGQFLETLARFFPNAAIIGIDVQPERVTVGSPNVRLVQGNQAMPDGLSAIFDRHAPAGFDIIIDDASHVGGLTKQLFDVAIQRLRAGGTYYIEDWGTGYMPDWPDGAAYVPGAFVGTTGEFPARYQSFDAGMIGVIKSLVDHVGAPALVGTPPIVEMSLWAGVVKLVKG